MKREELRSLCQTFDASGLTTLDWQQPGHRVRLVAGSSSAPPPPVAMPAAACVTSPSDVATEAESHVVSSPAVGWVRLSHPLMEGPLVKRGASVTAGDIVALIQVGPMMQPVYAGCVGTIVTLRVEEGDAVDFDAPLFEIRPTAGVTNDTSGDSE